MLVEFDETAYLAAARAGDYRKLVELQQLLLDDLLTNAADSAKTFAALTEIVARLFEVGRVGLWLFEENRERLLCLDLYMDRDNRHSAGNTMHSSEAPDFFATIRTDELLLVHDAYADPRTNEFVRGYLPAFGIGAMLDAPLHVRRRLLGLLCIEHIGGSRRWQPWERSLASSLVEVAGVLLGQVATRSRRPTLRDLRLG